jgi:flagellar hook assembly protein FlgD
MDPLFVNADSGNYHLSDNSPCIDAGDPSILDADSTISDMGAYGGGIMVHTQKPADGLSFPHFTLMQNYPNPFNTSTKIDYLIPEQDQVRLVVYDISGRLVAQLVNERQKAGYHTEIWNGPNIQGIPVSSGIYLYQISVGNFLQTKKMLLIR